MSASAVSVIYAPPLARTCSTASGSRSATSAIDGGPHLRVERASAAQVRLVFVAEALEGTT